MALEKINQVNDIKQIPPEEYEVLAAEIREFLIEKISSTGGHLASNLGVVELTMALHLSFDFPKDKVIWDVGHQAYTHKLLTGRKAGFDGLRKYGGMSGFPKRKESECDCFDTGHSSTSISAGIGLVAARDLLGGDEHIISVIGDGALTGGMAYEALNNASRLKKNFIIVLNDNHMSIAENVGGMSEYLNGLRTNEVYTSFKSGVEQSLNRIPGGVHLANQLKKTKSGIKQLLIPGMLFEDMGITYLGPVDGHDITKLLDVFRKARRVKGAVLVHVLTKKGKGYEPAERHPARFHGAEPFDIETGLPKNRRKKANYQDVFSTCMVKLGQRHDQVLHDVCIQNLPVIFAIDRAGLVGSDGETHQGIFDLSYLSSIPNMHIMAPKNKWELSDMLKFAVGFDGPLALRYPRGEAYDGLKEFRSPIAYGKSELLYEEEDIAILAVGSMVKTAEQVRRRLKEIGYSCTLVNARFVKPVDTDMITELSKDHRLLVTMEENVQSGGYGEKVQDWIVQKKLPTAVLNISIPDEYVEHGNVDILYEEVGIDAESVTKRIIEKYIVQG